MTSNSICRVAVLVAATACSLPFATAASHVRGGQDVANCTTRDTSDGDCLALSGQNCGTKKTVCNGCGGLGTFLNALCADDGGTPCSGAGCVTGQTNSKLSGSSCVRQNCQ